jgi:hypothetical protein
MGEIRNICNFRNSDPDSQIVYLVGSHCTHWYILDPAGWTVIWVPLRLSRSNSSVSRLDEDLYRWTFNIATYYSLILSIFLFSIKSFSLLFYSHSVIVQLLKSEFFCMSQIGLGSSNDFCMTCSRSWRSSNKSCRIIGCYLLYCKILFLFAENTTRLPCHRLF